MEILQKVKETREPIKVSPASLVKVMPVPVEMVATEEQGNLAVKDVEELRLVITKSLLQLLKVVITLKDPLADVETETAEVEPK